MDIEEDDGEIVDHLAELIKTLSKDVASNKGGKKIKKYQIVAQIKKAQVSGNAYVTLDGKLKPERKMGPACPVTCRCRCFERISQEERERLFNEFWSLPDRRSQWDYVAVNVVVEPKHKATTKDRVVVSRRANTRVYYFHLEHGIEKVCKTMFLNTLGIGNNWLHTVCKKMARYGYVKGDERDNFSYKYHKKFTSCMKKESM